MKKVLGVLLVASLAVGAVGCEKSVKSAERENVEVKNEKSNVGDFSNFKPTNHTTKIEVPKLALAQTFAKGIDYEEIDKDFLAANLVKTRGENDISYDYTDTGNNIKINVCPVADETLVTIYFLKEQLNLEEAKSVLENMGLPVPYSPLSDNLRFNLKNAGVEWKMNFKDKDNYYNADSVSVHLYEKKFK